MTMHGKSFTSPAALADLTMCAITPEWFWFGLLLLLLFKSGAGRVRAHVRWPSIYVPRPHSPTYLQLTRYTTYCDPKRTFAIILHLGHSIKTLSRSFSLVRGDDAKGRTESQNGSKENS